MPRSQSQRAKLLYLQKIFLKRSDEEHRLSRDELMQMLAEYGAEIERKTLYTDIETLRETGMDIILDNSSPRDCRYYLGSRDFELAELQLLANAVACSKFITDRKSRQLIEKISTLASVYNGSAIKKEVIVSDRVKAKNEHIYYNIDKIQDAIAKNVKIKFKYFGYNEKKQKVYHNDKSDMVISPYCLTWKDENYYCVGYYEKYNTIVNFRADKMEHVSVTNEKSIQTEGFNASEHSRKLFGMYGGTEDRVTLRFENKLAGVVLDRFGMDELLLADGDEHFTLCESVVISPIFYGWLTQFGGGVEIIKPQRVRDDYKKFLLSAAEKY